MSERTSGDLRTEGRGEPPASLPGGADETGATGRPEEPRLTFAQLLAEIHLAQEQRRDESIRSFLEKEDVRAALLHLESLHAAPRDADNSREISAIPEQMLRAISALPGFPAWETDKTPAAAAAVDGEARTAAIEHEIADRAPRLAKVHHELDALLARLGAGTCSPG